MMARVEDVAAEPAMLRLVNRTHATTDDFGEDFVLIQIGPPFFVVDTAIGVGSGTSPPATITVAIWATVTVPVRP
jgi:hypothetical protein